MYFLIGFLISIILMLIYYWIFFTVKGNLISTRLLENDVEDDLQEIKEKKLIVIKQLVKSEDFEFQHFLAVILLIPFLIFMINLVAWPVTLLIIPSFYWYKSL